MVYAVLEPAFQRPPLYEVVAGSETTIFAPATADDLAGLRFLGPEDLQALGIDPEQWTGQVGGAAEGIMEQLEPLVFRDENEIIEYAALTVPEEHLLTSVVFTDRFYETFESWFGPEFLVVAPNRFTLYVFPKLATTVADYGPIFLEQYATSPYPVSRELFERTREGLRAVGTFEPDREAP